MINQIIKNEKELRTLLKKSLKEACKDNTDVGSIKENKIRIDAEIDHFLQYEKPKEYPILVALDHTMHSIGTQVFLGTTYNYFTKTDLETHLRNITIALNEIVMEEYPKKKTYFSNLRKSITNKPSD